MARRTNYTHKEGISNRKEMRTRGLLTEVGRLSLLSCSILLLALVAAIVPEANGFHFTITGDMRDQHTTFGRVLQSINDIPEVNGPGTFLVSPGFNAAANNYLLGVSPQP
jgi:hypothetical protein